MNAVWIVLVTGLVVLVVSLLMLALWSASACCGQPQTPLERAQREIEATGSQARNEIDMAASQFLRQTYEQIRRET
jgi:hypothetical protein